MNLKSSLGDLHGKQNGEIVAMFKLLASGHKAYLRAKPEGIVVPGVTVVIKKHVADLLVQAGLVKETALRASDSRYTAEYVLTSEGKKLGAELASKLHPAYYKEFFTMRPKLANQPLPEIRKKSKNP